MDTSRLNVNTESLTTYANYLIESKTNLNNKLDELNNCMSTITTGWNDTDGHNFASSFSSFIKEARKISDEAGKLGDFAKKESEKYDAAVNRAIRKFGVSIE